jgi:ATP-dependent DNA helicase RecG
LTPQGGVTTAAHLLFGEHPQGRFPEAYVRVLRFEGLERKTGSRLNLREDVRCEGNLTSMIEAASGQVERLQPTRTALAASGRFERQGLIPRDAWLEGIVNAVVHRSYSIGGDHIRVEIYDNRIEITSPGRFPGVTRVDDFRNIPRFARNPRIARACADLRFGRELGEGIKRIFDEMRAAGLVDPVYRHGPAAVTLTLAATPLSPEVAERLPSRSSEVMEHIRSSGGLSTGDIADAIGLSKPAALTRLRALQEAGLIEWVGKSPKDPRAYWKLHSE